MMPRNEPTGTVDYQRLYAQVMAFVDQARPLADQMMAAGSLKEGLKVGLESVLGTESVTAGPREPGDPENGLPSPAEFPNGTNGAQPTGSSGGRGDLSDLSAALDAVAGKALPHALYVQGAVRVAELLHDYGVTVQEETTARHGITARRDVRVQEIEVARAVMEQYLTATFDERRTNFQALFARLDRAQDQGDLQGMQLVLSGILDLAKSSPFKDLATFKNQLNNPNFVLEL